MKITDKRTGRKTFGEVKVGQYFTIPEDDDLYVKISPVETDYGEEYNAFSFQGYEPCEIAGDEDIIEVNEIEIIIK